MAVDFTIGLMRSVGVFMVNTPTINSSGGKGDVYTDSITVRGQLRKRSGRKSDENHEIAFDKSFHFICRFRQEISINSDTQIRIDGNVYRINDFELVDEIKHLYQFNLWQVHSA